MIFKGDVPYLSTCREFEFDYIGTEVHVNGNMTKKQLEELEEQMREDFGFAPFELSKAKAVLGEFITYSVSK